MRRLARPEECATGRRARSIAAAGFFIAEEGLIGYRLRTFPLAIGVAKVRNSRSRAAADTGQNEEPPMPVGELLEVAAFGHEAKPPL